MILVVVAICELAAALETGDEDKKLLVEMNANLTAIPPLSSNGVLNYHYFGTNHSTSLIYIIYIYRS